MAISINWKQKIIYVPRADLTLIQELPIEIRELNINWFRLQLKSLEDSEEGMIFPDTHNHNTEVSLGGLTFARVIEIINGYTVTFEDGQYAVNLVGANTNTGDRVNVNQVSVRSSNSAGLISSPAIEFSSFNGAVTVDINSDYTGTVFPVGTPQKPVNNLSDALLIAGYRGFWKFHLMSNITVDSGGDYEGFSFCGENYNKTKITVANDAYVKDCAFMNSELTGILDGGSLITNCRVGELNYLDGIIEDSILMSNTTIYLSSIKYANIMNCASGRLDYLTDKVPIIDMGGSGTSLAIRNYNGSIQLTNKNGAEIVDIDLNSGIVILDSTITGGYVNIRGVGEIIDNSTGTVVVDIAGLMSKASIAEAITETIGSEIEYASFNHGVTIDPINGTDSSEYPYGTPLHPCKTAANSYAIRMERGFTTVYLVNDITFTGIPDGVLTNLHLVGVSGFKSVTVTVDNLLITNCTATNLKITGTFKNGSRAEAINCDIYDVTNVDLTARNCFITNGQYSNTEMFSCQIEGHIDLKEECYFSGVDIIFNGDTTTIDMQNHMCIVSLDISSGYFELLNTTTDCLAEFNLRGGEIELNENCTGGEFYIEGYGKIYNHSTMTIKADNLMPIDKINKTVTENQALILA